MYRRCASVFSVMVLTIGVALSACKPTYPQCKKDEHCQAKGEVCVQGQCQECRDTQQCTQMYPNETRECQSGRCEVRSECQADADCALRGDGLKCKDHLCVPECTKDSDCSDEHTCQDQKCQALCSGKECADFEDSKQDVNIPFECKPEDPNSSEVIALPTVYFGFNKDQLTPATRHALKQALQCIEKAPEHLKLTLTGFCDERGTEEYNMALGEKRSSAVLQYFLDAGLSKDRFVVRSMGQNYPVCTESTPACWSKNRRVEFTQKLN